MNELKIMKRNYKKRLDELLKVGLIPGTLHGSEIKTEPIQVPRSSLLQAMSRPGEVYELKFGGDSMLAKIQKLKRDPSNNEIIYFYFKHTPKNKKNDVEIPIQLKGLPKGVKKGGRLIIMKDDLTVNGKPRQIPDCLVANISDLDIGQKLVVNDLFVPQNLETIEDDSETVAICKPPVKANTLIANESLFRSTETLPTQGYSFPAQAI